MSDFVNLIYHSGDLPLTCASVCAVLLCIEFISAVFNLISDLNR